MRPGTFRAWVRTNEGRPVVARHRSRAVVLAATFVLASAPATAAPALPDERAQLLAEIARAVPAERAEVGDVLAGRLIVTWRAGVAPGDMTATLSAAGLPTEGIRRVQVLDIEPDRAADAAAVLHDSPLVELVTADRLVRFQPATDPLVPWQWGLRNTGQRIQGSNGIPGIDVGALDAWRDTMGHRRVTVAIIDTGVDITHPDLQANVWVNTAEAGGIPGIDDDDNGYVDDIHGWNFVTDSPQVYDHPVEDAHGTHVAGTVAAALDGAGAAGVAPRVRFMTLKFLGADGGGSTADAVSAVHYAADNGADVINASWAMQGPLSLPQRHALSQLETAIEDARIPFVAAAGNLPADGSGDGTFYPAFSPVPNIIAVAAIDNRGRLPTFSARSAERVDVAAPGRSILSTLPAAAYGYSDGTSMAAPHVTGIVALAISRSGDRNGARIARNLRRTTRPFGALEDTTRPSGATIAGLASAPGLLAHYGADLGACRGGAPPAGFSDVSPSNVHAPNIDCVVHRGLARGFPDGTYRPRTAVTRAQVATFLAGLYRTAAELHVPDDGQFPDVSDGNVHRDNIEALAAVGVIGGFKDGTFRPSLPVSREQFASLLVRTYQHLAQGEVRGRAPAFPDGGSTVHRDNVRLAAYLGFVQGKTDGTFGPSDDVTRAQLASLIRRALDKQILDRVSG